MRVLAMLIVCVSVMLGTMGCVEEAYAEQPYVSATPVQSCVVIADSYGEREVCGSSYVMTTYGPVYWDPYYSSWIGSGIYWYGGHWYNGYRVGYWDRYHGYYRPHGFYVGYARGYYGGVHWNSGYHGGGWHGGGFRGGAHVGGGHSYGHSGGHGGGHR